MKKQRADILLFENGFASSVDEAARLIMAGVAVADDKRIDKAGELISVNAELRLKERLPFVSRGGLKLQKAFDEFHIDVQGKIVIDIGSSTGGFTDVSLQYGAIKVYAIDVGKALLHNKLIRDPRVIVLEDTNFRTIGFEVINECADIIVTDVSFISLTLIIPKVVQFSKAGTIFIALIKPQFEAEREDVGAGGIVTEKAVHLEVSLKVIRAAIDNSFRFKAFAASPIKGAKGNIEYLAYFEYTCDIAEKYTFDDTAIKRVIDDECSIYS